MLILLNMEVISLSTIFEQGQFNRYAEIRLDGARESILEEHYQASQETTVFISHKHDDLNDLKGVLGFLEHTYKVKVYIDSQYHACNNGTILRIYFLQFH